MDAELHAAIRTCEAAGYRVRPPKNAAPPTKTLKEVLRRRQAGEKYKAIAAACGLTKGQVAGIIWRYRLEDDGEVRALSEQEKSDAE